MDLNAIHTHMKDTKGMWFQGDYSFQWEETEPGWVGFIDLVEINGKFPPPAISGRFTDAYHIIKTNSPSLTN